MITTKYLTKNRCYTSAKIITSQYVIVHSSGSAYGTKDKLFNNWNNANVSKAAHGMTDAEGGYLTLPLNYKGWHVGSKGNDKTIGFEICEPLNIAYKDAAHTQIDTSKYNPKDSNIIVDFTKRYNCAVEMAVYMCKQTGIPVENVICHAEAYKKGLATNHADVNHWFPLFGKSMDDFRADVKKALASGETRYYVQTGAYLFRQRAENQLNQVKAAGFDAILKQSGLLYKVQVGSYANRYYAENTATNLQKAGFTVYITTNGGTVVSANDFTVGDKVKCRDGVTTFANGTKMASWVPNAALYIRDIEDNGNVLLVSTEPTKKVYTGRVKATDVYKI